MAEQIKGLAAKLIKPMFDPLDHKVERKNSVSHSLASTHTQSK